MNPDLTEICGVIEEIAKGMPSGIVEELGHAEVLRDYMKEHDQLAEVVKAIETASAALTSDTTVNHLHKLTGVEALMIERYGAAKIDDDGLVETLKELLEELDQPDSAEDKVPTATVKVKDQGDLVMGRIVRYVEADGGIVPAIVSKVYDEDGVSLHAFPVRRDSYPVAIVPYSLGPMVDTWHWPND